MSPNVIAIIILVSSFFILMCLRLGVGFSMGIASILTMRYLGLSIESVRC